MNGVCLTIVALTASSFSVDVVAETLRRTNLGSLSPGAGVNLERAMPAAGRFGGHMVQGHVEATGEVVRLEPDGKDGVMAFYRAPEMLLPYIVPKGFIAIDGVSLTVVAIRGDEFSVTLIPFTREHTNLAGRRPGELVNLETDVLARYVERLVNLTSRRGDA